MPTFSPLAQNDVITYAPVELLNYASSLASGGQLNNCTRQVDTTTWGVPTLRITPTSDSNVYVALANGNLDWRKPWGASGPPIDSIVVEFYVQSRSATSGMTLRITENDAWTNEKSFVFTLNGNREVYGRHVIRIRLDQTTGTPGPYAGVFPYNSNAAWTDIGSPAGAASSVLRNFRLLLNNWFTGGHSVWLKSIYAGTRNRPKVVLYFDNWFGGTPSAINDVHHTALRPTLNTYGWKFGITIPTADLGSVSNGPISVQQTLESEGHDILLNDTQDRAITSISDSEFAQAIAQTRQTLRSYGLNRGSDIWVWNNHEFDTEKINTAIGAGIVMARAGASERAMTWRQAGALSRYELMRVGSARFDDMTSDQMYAQVEAAIKYGSDLHVYWHKIAPSGSASTRPSVVNATDYGDGLFTYTAAVLDFLSRLRRLEQWGLVDVVSPSKWYRGLTQPALVA
jgi:hypothetical protein